MFPMEMFKVQISPPPSIVIKKKKKKKVTLGEVVDSKPTRFVCKLPKEKEVR